MPPKKSNTNAAAGNTGSSKKGGDSTFLPPEEEVLQAVVFLDKHDHRLDPLTIDTPKVSTVNGTGKPSVSYGWYRVAIERIHGIFSFKWG